MTHTNDRLLARLADARSNKVIFVSHCMLDENVRYLGGAFHSGAPPEAAQLVARLSASARCRALSSEHGAACESREC